MMSLDMTLLIKEIIDIILFNYLICDQIDPTLWAVVG